MAMTRRSPCCGQIRRVALLPQNFSQVTNPPIDPLREERVMSLKNAFRNLGNVLVQDEKQTESMSSKAP